MPVRLPLLLVLAVPLLFASPDPARAAECDFTWILINTDGSKATPDQHAEKERREQECRKRLADEKRDGPSARARLASEFKIDASQFSDGQAIARLAEEIDARKRAEQKEQENRRMVDEARRASQAGTLMDQQAEMLENLGVKLDADDGEDDGGVDPVELQMYQEMLDNGIAPGCKGKKGEALIDCVDAVLDAE